MVVKYTGPTIKKPDYVSDSTALLKSIKDDVLDAKKEDKAVPSEHLPYSV